MSRLLNLALAVLGIALVPATLRAFDVTEPVPVTAESDAVESEVVESTEADVVEPFEDGLMPPSWSFVGCISLGGSCKDVFVDGDGAYWVCKACGTTSNPGPGKCRKLTRYELDNALWCS